MVSHRAVRLAKPARSGCFSEYNEGCNEMMKPHTRLETFIDARVDEIMCERTAIRLNRDELALVLGNTAAETYIQCCGDTFGSMHGGSRKLLVPANELNDVVRVAYPDSNKIRRDKLVETIRYERGKLRSTRKSLE